MYSFLLVGCKEYLSLKPDKKLATPSNLQDLEALLNHVNTMNNLFSGLGEIASDNIYIPESNFNGIWMEEDRLTYIWSKTPVRLIYWQNSYRTVLAANVVLQSLENMDIEIGDRTAEEIKGMAHFFRGMMLFNLAQVFAAPYATETADAKLGIVLRLSPDVNLPSTRSSLRETYDQILWDLETATHLLRDTKHEFPTRPNKSAAYAALSRCHLAMRNYDKAGAYADSCLNLYDVLLDYHVLDTLKAYPFERFNEEIIFDSQLRGESILSEAVVRINPDLYNLYSETDRRKKLFFIEQQDHTHIFVGDYAQSASVSKFNGLTTAEVWLTYAECLVRGEQMTEALQVLKQFLKNRIALDELDSLSVDSKEELLDFILKERRKELLFRGLRWLDIRRLSFEPDHAVDLKREIGELTYTMSVDEIKDFAYLIPQSVIDLANLPQN